VFLHASNNSKSSSYYNILSHNYTVGQIYTVKWTGYHPVFLLAKKREGKAMKARIRGRDSPNVTATGTHGERSKWNDE